MSLSVTMLDCLIVLVVVVSAGYAAWRGFLWETLTIFAWVAAAFACLYFGPYLIQFTRSLVTEPWLASVLAYAAVFLAVLIPLAFMTARFSQSVKNSPIGPLDRAAGVAFGLVRGLVIVGLAYLAFTYFVAIRNQPKWLTEARLLPVVQTTADLLLSVVPDRPREDFDAAPRHEIVRQAPPENSVPPASHDSMADLIRQNQAANSVPKSTPQPAPQKSASKTTKAYGASDRQALDRLVETGGSGKP